MMKRRFYIIFNLLILFNIFTINARGQNAEIDTITNYKPYIEYLSRSDYFIELIAENKLDRALKIYNLRGHFFGGGRNIKKNLEDFRKLIDLRNKKVYLVRSHLILPQDGSIPPQYLDMLSIFYTFPSKYNGLRNQIEIDYPLRVHNKGYKFDLFFHTASDEYEMKREIDALPKPAGKINH